MDDRFLYLLREQPDPAFVVELNKKLAEGQPESHRFFSSMPVFQKPAISWFIAVIVISVLAVSAISPVKAYLSPVILKLTGQTFLVTEDYPGDDHPGEETIIEPQLMSLRDALAIFPHPISLTANLPSGYSIDEDNVRVYVGETAGPFANTIEMNLSNAEAVFHLSITDLGSGEIVAPDSVKEILLDEGHPAYVIQGGWNADKKEWDYDQPGVRLRWSVDNLTYNLSGANREQLIEIALSTLE